MTFVAQTLSVHHQQDHVNGKSSANDLSRRGFLQLVAASIAFAGLSGCQIRQPVEKIIPYVRQPEEIVPGKPLFYATAMSLGGYALGLHVRISPR